MDINTKSTTVAVCIATYKRPLGLERLLSSLRSQRFNKFQTPDWCVIVIENDSSMPSKTLVDTFKRDFPVPIIYNTESTRGIASTRNRAVQMAGNIDFIAFIDDDEVADPNWLDELLYIQQKYNADVVKGPVLTRFEQEEPEWVTKGRFYERPRYPTGARLEYTNIGTGNVLIRHEWLHAVDGPFNEEMNLTGGTNTLFFAQISKLGANSISADSACVEEYQPPGRVSARWLIMRALRTGASTAIVHKMVTKRFKLITIRILKSVVRIFIGIFSLIPLSIYDGYSGTIRSLRMIAIGCGEIGGFLGIRYQEYKNVHGS